ncbi:MAG: FAD:protein FMN transferase [Sedimentisphaerales bacterium]|nr:FAD:protein FMN transferase [Sedimentisphaerales bacterium]
MANPSNQAAGIRPPSELLAGVHRFCHQAMATTLEIYIRSENYPLARQAAQECFYLTDRLEEELSRFIPGSDVWRINHLAAGESVKVGDATLECLQQAEELYRQTGGAFDVTIGALRACWRNDDRSERTPTKEELAAAAARTGMDLLAISPEHVAVGVKVDGVQVDLGGIGKGYAVDRMAAFLREWDFENALVCGGASTVLAAGRPAGRAGWPVSVSDPLDPGRSLEIVQLVDRALSGSGVTEQGEHIIDPGTRKPVGTRLRTWAQAPTATHADALSTAFLIMPIDQIEDCCRARPEVGALVTWREDGRCRARSLGRWQPTSA